MGVTELRWAYVVFGLLAFIDVLIGMRGVQRLFRHEGQIYPDAPFFLLALLLLQLLLIWLYVRLRRLFRSYRHLREAHEQELDFTRQLLDSATEGIVMFSTEGRILYANRAAGDILGHSAASLTGKWSLELLVPEERVAIQEQITQAWGKPNQVYHFHIHDDAGKVRPIRMVTNPRWHHGRIVGTFGSIQPEVS